ncbi:MAG: hypothetical protein E6G97_12375 [Alphaproteobacteria bacterium]|nr:MAG: hypothetical protein E6G97_12375 [Alphaproteobacteria bacterium]
MPKIDRELCRKAAAECVELARATTDPERRQVLLTRAQEWLKLAYAEPSGQLEGLLAGFNEEQMDSKNEERAPVPSSQPQRQEVQQQQSKMKPDDETA